MRTCPARNRDEQWRQSQEAMAQLPADDERETLEEIESHHTAFTFIPSPIGGNLPDRQVVGVGEWDRISMGRFERSVFR